MEENSMTKLIDFMLKMLTKMLLNYFFHSCYLKGTVSDVFHPKVSLFLQPHFQI